MYEIYESIHNVLDFLHQLEGFIMIFLVNHGYGTGFILYVDNNGKEDLIFDRSFESLLGCEEDSIIYKS